MMLRNLLQPALRGMKANFIPGLALQVFSLLIVVGYFRFETVASWLNGLGAFKAEYGYPFSAVSTGVFGGLLPFSVLYLTKRIPRGAALKQLGFYLAFWTWKGVEVDDFYRAQAAYFGDTQAPSVIALKTLVDQLGYSPLWSAPTQTIFFLWKDCGFSIANMRVAIAERSFIERSIPVLFSTWIVWVPAVAIIYTLPATLQLPLFNLVLCFWCLLLSFVSRESTPPAA
jgi:hypothetical protein